MAKLIEARTFYNMTCDTSITVDMDLEWMLFHVSQWFLRGVIIVGKEVDCKSTTPSREDRSLAAPASLIHDSNVPAAQLHTLESSALERSESQ